MRSALSPMVRDRLYAHYQPADPVSEHLVEHVAACMWRLRRLPQIEAGIYAYSYLCLESGRAEARRKAEEYHFGPPSGPGILDEKAHAAAKKDEERAEAKLQGYLPFIGGAFKSAECSLISLLRIAVAIETSLYKAIDKLDRMKAERSELMDDRLAIDAEMDEGECAEADEGGWDFD